jgi:hypothetical protein
LASSERRGAVALGQSGGPLSRGKHGRFDGASAKIRTTIDTLKLEMRLAIAISK